MAQIVVPFRGESGKQRLDASEEIRSKLALAMLGDVITACVATGPTFLVTSDDDARALADELGAEIVDDPEGGQGAAVAAGLARVQDGPVVVLCAGIDLSYDDAAVALEIPVGTVRSRLSRARARLRELAPGFGHEEDSQQERAQEVAEP